MVVNETRRHIVDYATFLDLGYRDEDVVACSGLPDAPQGPPITRLVKGSDERVYWVELGARRHIPNMETFAALGYREEEIAILPDAILDRWPEGEPIATVLPPELYRTLRIGEYTVDLYHPGTGGGLYDHAVISAPGRAPVRVDAVQEIGELPAADVTGEGNPDLLLNLYMGGSHCCWGLVLYDLGEQPREVLGQQSPAYQIPATGRGAFEDLDGDGSYEFITRDPLEGIPCSQPSVLAVLRYDEASAQYVGASPQYPQRFADEIARHTVVAEEQREESRMHFKCAAYGVIMDYLYPGRPAEARRELERLYLGADREQFWQQLQVSASRGRCYVAR